MIPCGHASKDQTHELARRIVVARDRTTHRLLRNTTRGLRKTNVMEPAYPTRTTKSVLDPWGKLLSAWLYTDQHRPIGACECALVGGVRRRLEVAHVKLAHSRAFWLVAYWGQSHEMLFDVHTRTFSTFGGVPKRGLYDSMKTAIDRIGRGRKRTSRSSATAPPVGRKASSRIPVRYYWSSLTSFPLLTEREAFIN